MQHKLPRKHCASRTISSRMTNSKTIFLPDHPTLQSTLPMDAYGSPGSVDGRGFVDAIADAVSLNKRLATVPSQLLGKLLNDASIYQPSVVAGFMAIIDVDKTTERDARYSNDNDALLELAKIMSCSSQVIVVTDNAKLQQAVNDLGLPFVTWMTPRQAAATVRSIIAQD